MLGGRYDADRYELIKNLCRISSSIQELEGEDKLILFDNGSNITLKLRKKLMLARMLYLDFDICIIDEFINDLDAEFRQYFMTEIIRGYLSSKTVVIVTDRLDICKQTDSILVFKDGSIAQQGSFDELVNKRNGLFC